MATSATNIPIPQYAHIVLGRILGHLPEIWSASKTGGKSAAMGMYLKREEWYKATQSKTFNIVLPGSNLVFCADPAVYKEILGSKQDHFSLDPSIQKVIGSLFPTAFTGKEGEEWQRGRKVFQRALSKQSLDPVVKIMCDLTDSVTQDHRTNKIVTGDITNRVTFDAFFRLMYRWDPKAVTRSEDAESLLQTTTIIVNAIASRFMLPVPWLWTLPTAENKEINAALTVVGDMADKFIMNSRASLKLDGQPLSPSFIDLLVIAADEAGADEVFSRQLHDVLTGLFFAAYETTSSALHMLLYHLARAPEIQDKLRNSLRERFPRLRADLERSTLADLETVTYLGQVLDEVHRLHPFTAYFPRGCIRDIEIAGLTFRRGMSVMIDSGSVCRDPAYWPGQTDLDCFRPERWEEFRPPRGSGPLPFGFGGRICPGRQVALAEMKAFVAAVLCSHRVVLREPEAPLECNILLGFGIQRGTGNIDFLPLDA